jgi:hypothetical protein
MNGYKQGEAISRRTVVETGAKLAYAAPLVAASFKIGANAVGAVSPTCKAGTCADPNVCGERCGCREADSTTYCLQQMRCSDAQVCSSTAECQSGYVCLPESCCRDGKNRCVPICATTEGLRAQAFGGDDDLVLGPEV